MQGPAPADTPGMNAAFRAWILLAALAAGCSSIPARSGRPATTPDAGTLLRVQIAEAGHAVQRVRLEDYVRAAVLSELSMPAGDPDVVARMMEVQAVVARTYALANRGRHAGQGFDLCSATHCQLYQPSRLRTSRWAAVVNEAVRQTAGEVLWHAGAPAAALFHADCGGHTSTSVNAWGGTARPYLRAVRDDGPAESAHAEWTYSVPMTTILVALNDDPRTRVGSRLDTVRIVERDVSGRAATVALHGREERLVRGEDLRAVLTRRLGSRAIRSTLFDVRRDGMAFVFEGRGFGHGVGLCQAGALARIRAGAQPADVLQRYFPGTIVEGVRSSHGAGR